MTMPSGDARQGNTNRAVTRVRRSLGKKRQLLPLEVKGAFHKTTPRKPHLRTLGESPGMVTLQDGRVKFRPMRPVPRSKGKM
jgi:hypothetical protein